MSWCSFFLSGRGEREADLRVSGGVCFCFRLFVGLACRKETIYHIRDIDLDDKPEDTSPPYVYVSSSFSSSSDSDDAF